MSAPTHEAPPVEEQLTLPLPIHGTQNLPGGGNWLMSEHGVLLLPAMPVAAGLLGELVLRPYLFLTEEARSDLAIALLPLVLIFVVGGGFLFARRISRGKDGRA